MVVPLFVLKTDESNHPSTYWGGAATGPETDLSLTVKLVR